MRRFLVTALAAAAGGVASADVLYTVRVNDGMLVRLDTDTLALTDVGPLGVGYDFGGLAYDGSTMYMVQGFAGSGLYTVDLDTGAATLVGDHGSTAMFGLEFDPTTNALYGSESTRASGFYELSRADGSATFIGDMGRSIDGLSYDTTRDDLIGVEAGPGEVYSVDRASGSTSLLAVGDFINNCGMAYIASLDEHWVIDWSGNLYSLDPSNGYARTQLASFGTSYDGLALVPAPGALGVLALGGLATARRRR